MGANWATSATLNGRVGKTEVGRGAHKPPFLVHCNTNYGFIM